MDNLERSLKEEVKRFNQIGYNSMNLEEQTLGSVGGGSGFMSKQGESPRLEKFKARQLEMSEQEDPEVPALEDEEMASFAEMGVGDEEVAVDIEGELGVTDETTPPPPPPAPEVPAAETTEPVADEDTTEVEVTDLVDKQESIENSSVETNEKLDTLMGMLDGMEDKLEGMDELMNQITSLEQKIEEFRPQTEREKLNNRKMDSGPFSQSVADFWDDSQEKFEEQGKKEYILTTDDIDNFSDMEIQKSFNV